MTRNQLSAAVCLALAIGTFVLYLPIMRDGFINFDDDAYITGNSHVKAGLTWSGVVWAFKSGYAANWHPLTWISHMMDCQLFGLDPAGHHLMNVLFHTANTVLLFLLLNGMTGALWRSAFVAALFGWHPLHVESVAWASERKDVLSAFFWMLTLMAYARYVGQASKSASVVGQASSLSVRDKQACLPVSDRQDACPTSSRPVPGQAGCLSYYFLALLFFACGLMSKPMVVTLPFVLLLLDFWPLGRFNFCKRVEATPRRLGGKWSFSGGEGAAATLQPFNPSTIFRLLIEKIPFLALSCAGCIVTYLVQKTGGAVVMNDPLSFRVANALWSYQRYIAKIFWPTDLAIVYPFLDHGLRALAAISAVLLIVCSFVFIFLSRRWPYLFTGWFWFLGTLVPVVGIVEVGSASMADRYAYLPSIGLFILVTWGAADFFEAKRAKKFPAALAVAVLAACVILTSMQIRYWRSSITLFSHALEVTTDNYVACACLGQALDVIGDENDALKYCKEAVRIDPDYPPGQFFLGQVLWRTGDTSEAFKHLNVAARDSPHDAGFQYNLGKFLWEHGLLDKAEARFYAALNADPDFAEAHNALGKTFLKQGKLKQAQDELAKAADLDPDDAQLHYDLGTFLLMNAQVAKAIAQFSEAIRLEPDFAAAHENLAAALATHGNLAQAIAHYSIAARLQPNDPDAHFNLGFAYLNNHQPVQAAEQFSEELRLTPNQTKGQYRLAQALREQNKLAEAVVHYRQALRLTPNFPEAQKELDEILAAHPQLR